MSENALTKIQSKFKPGVYRHFNGELYHAIGIAEHETKGERNVVYYDEHGEMWLRSVQSFNGKVNAANYSGLRFVLVTAVNQGRVPVKELVKKG